MRVCYVDESGDLGPLASATSDTQPVFVIAGLSIPRANLAFLTHDFLRLKKQFFPQITKGSYLDTVLVEIKGADLRRSVALGRRDERRHAIGFLDKVLSMLVHFEAKLFVRLWVKGIAVRIDHRAVYTFSMQDICTTFQHQLTAAADIGLVVADSRNKFDNAGVSHSVFTQMFKTTGNPYDRIVEMPTFGHSDNHVGLQIADLLCSALLYPIAVHTYCTGYIQNVHVRPGNATLKTRYGSQLRELQFRYQEPVTGRWRGGITVNDILAKRSAAELFR